MHGADATAADDRAQFRASGLERGDEHASGVISRAEEGDARFAWLRGRGKGHCPFSEPLGRDVWLVFQQDAEGGRIRRQQRERVIRPFQGETVGDQWRNAQGARRH